MRRRLPAVALALLAACTLPGGVVPALTLSRSGGAPLPLDTLRVEIETIAADGRPSAYDVVARLTYRNRALGSRLLSATGAPAESLIVSTGAEGRATVPIALGWRADTILLSAVTVGAGLRASLSVPLYDSTYTVSISPHDTIVHVGDTLALTVRGLTISSTATFMTPVTTVDSTRIATAADTQVVANASGGATVRICTAARFRCGHMNLTVLP